MAIKYRRAIDEAGNGSPYDADVIENNYQSGAKKVLTVGPHLIPIPTSSPTVFTTNVSGTPVGLPKLGLNLAIYNNAGAVGTVTIGNTPSITSQAIGASDTAGNVGCACPPNAWTYLSMGNNRWVISSAATLIVYLIEDSTFISAQSSS